MLVQPAVVELSAYAFAQAPDWVRLVVAHSDLAADPLCWSRCAIVLTARNASVVPLALPRFSRASTWRRKGSLGDIAIALPFLSAVRVDVFREPAQTRCDRGGRGFVRRSPVPSIIVNSLLALSMYMEIYSHPLAYALKRTKIDGLGRTLSHRFARRHRERQQITGGSNRSCRCCGKWLMLPMKGRNLRVALSERMLLHPYCV